MTNGRALNYREFSNQPHIKHLDEVNKKYQYNLYSVQMATLKRLSTANLTNLGQNNQQK
jgi:hypothetical protein